MLPVLADLGIGSSHARRKFVAANQLQGRGGDFTKLFPPEIRKGLTEALYQHMDENMRALMRMYEFHAMEGLLNMPPATEVEVA